MTEIFRKVTAFFAIFMRALLAETTAKRKFREDHPQKGIGVRIIRDGV